MQTACRIGEEVIIIPQLLQLLSVLHLTTQYAVHWISLIYYKAIQNKTYLDVTVCATSMHKQLLGSA